MTLDTALEILRHPCGYSDLTLTEACGIAVHLIETVQAAAHRANEVALQLGLLHEH